MSDTDSSAEATRLEALARRVLDVLNQVDLEGLHPGEPGWAPIDEYENEARAFARLLDQNGSIDVPDLRRVWSHWFSNDASHLSPAETEQLIAALNGCTSTSTETAGL